MSNATVPYKKDFSGTVGAGMGAIVSPKARRYYILEHKESGNKYLKDRNQEILIDQILIGRAPECQVRFDDNFPTVSRKHAAIQKVGEMWVLQHLSATNSTLVNGRKMEVAEWSLQDGDEIQFAVDGPKVIFRIPPQPEIANLGLTHRVAVAVSQSLKPYRIAVRTTMALAILALLLGGFNLYQNWILDKFVREVIARIGVLNEEMLKVNTNIGMLDQKVGDLDGKFNDFVGQMGDKINDLDKAIATANQKASAAAEQARKVAEQITANHDVITAWDKSVYFIQCAYISVVAPDGESASFECPYTGSGFMLNDNRFVTARHVAVPWVFPGDDDVLIKCSAFAEANCKVDAHLVAYSPAGDRIEMVTSEFTTNTSTDRIVDVGNGWKVRVAKLDKTDWASCIIPNKQGLSKDSNKSVSMKRGEKVHITGFPLGLGANSPNDIHAIYSTAEVASDGLSPDGTIILSDANSEHGNSGGPVLYMNGGKSSVIGLVSAGAGRNVGFIVPIAEIDHQ